MINLNKIIFKYNNSNLNYRLGKIMLIKKVCLKILRTNIIKEMPNSLLYLLYSFILIHENIRFYN
jgi:hypothetical protein